MINLITGTPGAGKTLFSIDMVLTLTGQKQLITKGKKKQTQDSDRPVYYFHINGLDEEKTGWIKMDDPHNWNQYPEGSIFVIDESHKFFPKIGTGKLPKEIEDLSEHRHKGYDFYFITQQHMMINHHIRGLVNAHYHFERQQGWDQNTRYLWNRLGNITDYHEKKTAEKKRQRFSSVKYIYPLYKSATMHTSKKRIPFMLWVGLAFLLYLIYAGYGLYKSYFAPDEQSQETPSQPIETKVPNAQVVSTFQSGETILERYNSYYNGEQIIKGYYPDFIVNASSVYKTKILRDHVYYEFNTGDQTYSLSQQQLKTDYSIKVDSLTNCRDAIYLPEMQSVHYTTCVPRIVHNQPLLYSSGYKGLSLSDTQRTRKPQNTKPQPKIKQTTQQPKQNNVNPFNNFF